LPISLMNIEGKIINKVNWIKTEFNKTSKRSYSISKTIRTFINVTMYYQYKDKEKFKKLITKRIQWKKKDHPLWPSHSNSRDAKIAQHTQICNVI
jgi:hypothetical protein